MRRNGYHYPGILFISLMAILAGPVLAEVYKWVDEQGNVHFGDKPKDRELAEKLGASRFMTKPFSNGEVLETVRALVGQ